MHCLEFLRLLETIRPAYLSANVRAGLSGLAVWHPRSPKESTRPRTSAIRRTKKSRLGLGVEFSSHSATSIRTLEITCYFPHAGEGQDSSLNSENTDLPEHPKRRDVEVHANIAEHFEIHLDTEGIRGVDVDLSSFARLKPSPAHSTAGRTVFSSNSKYIVRAPKHVRTYDQAQ
jgi:hypothetical protein